MTETHDITVTVVIGGTKFGASFPSDTDPDVIGDIVRDTVKINVRDPWSDPDLLETSERLYSEHQEEIERWYANGTVG